MLQRFMTFVLLLAGTCIFASDRGEQQPLTFHYGQEVRFIHPGSDIPNTRKQELLRNDAAWQSFYKKSGWRAEFDENSGLPHSAAGTNYLLSGSTREDQIRNFISGELGLYQIPVNQLMLTKVYDGEKFTYVHFRQQYNGLDVLWSQFTAEIVAGTNNLRLFYANLYPDIQINTQASMSQQDAVSMAVQGITDPVTKVQVEPDLSVLPIPHNGRYEYHLVYTVWIETYGGEIPGRYYTLVDAHNPQVLYRQNQVHTTFGEWVEKEKKAPVFEPATPSPLAMNVHMESTITDNPGQPTVLRGLPYMTVTLGSTTSTTDINGDVGYSFNPPKVGSYLMEGTYCKVYLGQNGTQEANFTNTLSNTNNTVSFDNDAINSERSAYYHVNSIHEHMKAYTPAGFTTLDGQMLTRVERTDGNCNAFYNGDVNFYAAGGGCPSTALFNDVVYHEYGHGINYDLYNYYGGSFTNGALGEGYGDVWAFTLTQNPVLGDGFSGTGTVVRRYDQDPKIYPQDLVGEVHADGEIIAGAWWDLGQNLSNIPQMTTIWQGTHPATLTQPDGNEGVLYRDILLETLSYDDNDGNLFNGTPNATAICDAFGRHGITLVSNATIVHQPVRTATASTPVTIDVTISATSTTYLGNVMCYYSLNNSASWSSLSMTNTSGNNYTVDIPGQPDGTIIHYYLAIVDNVCGYPTGAVPVAANATPPNIPYNILVGYTLQATEDFDFNNFPGGWLTGLPGDNATTGIWEINIPMGSYGTVGDTSTMVQTSYQHTPGGQLCMLTGNASSPADGIGTNDVDAGVTTLESPVIDLSSYTNPALTYFRWYINNPPSGANPNADWWQVKISNDGGSTWTDLEDTRVSDRSWRRAAFRVSDYVTPTSQMMLRFFASDSTHIGQYLDGGSLIEAALDDIMIWDAAMPLSTTATSQDVACNGGNDGQATVTAGGGTSPYTYLWDDPSSQTTATATGLAAGTYCCTVTDASSGTSTSCVTITEPPAMTGTTATTTANCGNADGTATVTAGNGQPPYTYLWDDPAAQTSATATGLGGGAYNVTVTDQNGCTATASATVSSTPAVQASATVNNASCGSNDGDATVSVSAGTSPYTYQWDGNAGNQTTTTATGLGAGTYVVTVTDQNGCSTAVNANVSNTGAPSLTLQSTTDVLCNGGSDGAIDISVSGGITPYTYQWDDPSSSTTEDVSGIPAGTYNVTVTDNSGCMTIQAYTVTEPTAVIGTATTTDASCNGLADGSIDLTPSGGVSPYTFQWDDPASSTTEDLSSLPSGTYQVTITDANGCTGVQSTTVSQPTSITATATVVDNQTVGSIDLTPAGGQSPFTYNWSGPGGFTSTTEDLLTINQQGTYWVTITDAAGCTSVDSFVVAGIVYIEQSGSAKMELKLFPNPANNRVEVLILNAGTIDAISVSNLLGQNVIVPHTSPASNRIFLSMGELARGVYFVKVISEGRQLTRKLILE